MEKIKHSEDISSLIAALVKAQDKMPTMKKNEEGYGYNYSSLADTIEQTRGILAEHGLVIIQLNTNIGDNPAVVTTLAHTSGQYISSTVHGPVVDMKGCNNMQGAGATCSYLRRYALQAILNLGSEDNDASSNGYKKPEKKTYPKKVEKKVESKDSIENTEEDIF